jgi:hypothetical protein
VSASSRSAFASLRSRKTDEAIALDVFTGGGDDDTDDGDAGDGANRPPPPPPVESSGSPAAGKKPMTRAQKKAARAAEQDAEAAAAARRDALEHREKRERRFLEEIESTRATLDEHREMWVTLVKDSEVQIADLRAKHVRASLDVEKVKIDAERDIADYDKQIGALTDTLVATKMEAAEVSGEVDMLEHHIGLYRRHS